MRLLVDTHILIWFAVGNLRLPQIWRKRLSDRAEHIVFSAESLREIAIKGALSKPDFSYSAEVLYRGCVETGWKILPTMPKHVFALGRLPLLHRDPFDRLLVAQAQVEGFTLLTIDGALSQYGPFVITI